MPKTTPALLRTFGPLIYSRCRRALNDDALAETAMQEVFLRVCSRLELHDVRAAVEAVAEACELVGREPAFRARWRASRESAA